MEVGGGGGGGRELKGCFFFFGEKMQMDATDVSNSRAARGRIFLRLTHVESGESVKVIDDDMGWSLLGRPCPKVVDWTAGLALNVSLPRSALAMTLRLSIIGTRVEMFKRILRSPIGGRGYHNRETQMD